MEEAIEPSTTEEVQETEETQEATGLLDNATPEKEEVSADSKETEIDHRDPEEIKTANQDDNKAEKPEFISSNFWNEEKGEVDLEALANHKLTLENKYLKENIKLLKMACMTLLHLVKHQMMILLNLMCYLGLKTMV